MANALYSKAKEQMLDGTLDIDGSTIKVVLVDNSGYTFSAAHTGLADISAGDRVATSGALASKTVTGGTFDAADETITGVTGNTISRFVIYKDTGVEATSTLIAYFDTDSTPAAISLVPNGSDVLITFDAAGIFSL